MKKRQLLLVFIILITGFTLKSYGQAPQQFNYQGAARNSNGTPLANKNISLRISILNGSSDGTVQYSEVRNVITNALGLYNIAIGSPGATSVTGTIAGVTWQNGSKYIKVEVDPNNGINFNLAGTAQLLSVPYAMYAGNGGSSAPETVTVLKDNGDGTYTYTSEDKTVTVVNVPASVKSNIQNILADNAVKAAFTQLINQSGGNVNYDATNKTFTYKDAQGNTQNIDLSQVTGAQTITTLTKNPTTSVYTYTNEAGAKVDIDVVGDVKNNFQDIANNPNVKNVLQQVAGNATSVVKYDATTNQFTYTDATGKSQTLSVPVSAITGSDVSAASNKIKLTNNAGAALKAMTIDVDESKLDLSNLGGKLNTTQLASGANNQVLVTNATGKVAWVDKTALSATVIDGTTLEGSGTTADPFKVKDLGIVTAKLADNAVTSAKLADGSVIASKLSAGVGTAGRVAQADATGAVSYGALPAGAVTGKNLTSSDLDITGGTGATLTDVSATIKNNAITTAKIAAGTNNQVLITDGTGKVAWVDKAALNAAVADGTTISGTGTTADPFVVKDLGITTAKLADNAITTAKIAAGTNNQVLVTDATGKVAWVDKTALAASVADLTTIEGTGTTADPFKVKDLGIVEGKLANDAVTTLKIKDANVTTTKIAAGTNNQVLVTDATGKVAWVDKTALAASVADLTTIEGTGTTADPFKVKDLGIVEAKLANDAVTTLKIKDANVTTAKLADNAVTTAKITDANVTTTKIAAGTNNQVLVTDATGKVAWVDKTALAASVADLTTIEGTGTTADPFKVKDLGIVEAKLANDAVTTLKIKDANVTTAKLADNAVTTAKITDANITTTKIAAGTNNQVLITDATGKVAWVDKTALAASVADLTTIEGTGTTADPFKVKDLGIVEAKLANDAVTTLKIKDANVTTTKIAAGTNNQVLVTDATGKVAWVDKTALAASVADLTTIEGTGTTADPFKVKDLGIVEAKLANDAVTTLKIKDANVTTGKIAAGTNNQVLVTDATGKVLLG